MGRALRGRFRSPRRELVVFLALGAVVLLAVGAVTVALCEVIARRNALTEAADVTSRLARLTVAPLLPGALAGVAADQDSLDRLIDVRLRDGSLVSAVVWTADGTIVWSSDLDLVGEQVETDETFARAVAGETVADVDDDPETGAQGAAGQPVVEVYTPMPVPGADLVFEAYYSYAGVERQTRLLRGQLLLVAVGGLVLLQAFQIPIAVSMARRISRDERARTASAARSLVESDRERRNIAADLHDGPVQDLAGVAYALGSLRLTSGPPDPGLLDELDGSVREAVGSLRRLMVDVHPPDLGSDGLPQALADLAASQATEALAVEVVVGDLPPLAPAITASIYRTTRELLSNVRRHSGAGQAWVELRSTGDEGAPEVTLVVADDGVGFPSEGVDRRREGHLGLRLVADRATEVGGSCRWTDRPGGGAQVVVTLPVAPPS